MLDFPGAAAELGLLPKLTRKPWLVLEDARFAFEARFRLGADELLVALAAWMSSATSTPSAAGVGHVSGNIYLAPALQLGPMGMSPEEVLVANAFSHGEIGIDAVASALPPGQEASRLLREIATFKKMRWVDASVELVPETPPPEGVAKWKFVKSARRALRRHPLVSAVGERGAAGRCLQHPGFVHRDLEGSSIGEYQVSTARNSAFRAYCPDGLDPAPFYGCTLLAGSLYAGSSVATREGTIGLSPMQVALTSLGANGASTADVVSAVWTAVGDVPGAAEAAEADAALLRAVAPNATFTLVRTEPEE